MQLSIRQIGIIVVWLAVILGLIGLVRAETLNQQFSSKVASDCILIGNLALSLFALLRSVFLSGQQQKFWIGFSMVAILLTVAQAAKVRFPGVELNAATWIQAIAFEDRQPMGFAFTGGHIDQLGCIMTYGWTPMLAWLGGWYAAYLSKWSRSRHAVD